MGQTLFFVTMVQVFNDEIADTCCVGFFEKYNEAERALCSNALNIREGIYDYAVIESLQSGLYQVDPNHKWFQAYESDRGNRGICYREIVKPDFAKYPAGFAIG